MKMFNISEILDGIIESVQNSFSDEYHSYGFVANTKNIRELKEDLYLVNPFFNKDGGEEEN